MLKTIIVICDGLPDRPLRVLAGKTPLEAAETPNLDKLAVDGISGMMHTVDVGVRPGSDTAHLAILGYDPYIYYTGRGPYECAGIGLEVLPGDVAFRANAGTVGSSGMVIDRRAGRISSTRKIIDCLGEIKIDGIEFIMKPGLSHRIGLIARGKGLSPKISDQDPHKVNAPVLKVKPQDMSKEAQFTAEVMNKFSGAVTEKLSAAPFNQERKKQGLPEANTILFRGAGSLPEGLLSFYEKYHLKAAFIAGAPFYKGIAKVFGIDVADIPAGKGVTGLPDSNLNFKIETAIRLINDYDMVFVHFKGADTLTEDGDFEGKIKFIEKIDAAIKPLVLREDILAVITSDHTTSSELLIHTADPVPI
ncbi:2,3-bisphosphoglycerate-independent phosphoglycerate mutase, partial [Candidatus Parcubacteria bacterium]